MEFVKPAENRKSEEPEVSTATFDVPNTGVVEEVAEESLPVVKQDYVIQNLTQHAADILSKYYTESELAQLDSSFTPEQAQKIHSSIMNMSTGAYSSIPRTCLGRRCPSQHSCPFIHLGLQQERVLLGKKCPVEVMLIEEYRGQYNLLVESNKQDPTNIVIRNYISDLIECDITNMRMNHYLAGSPDVGGGEITENVFVINPKTGQPEYQKTENIALAIKQFVSIRKDRAIQALVASPFWQKKFEPRSGANDDVKELSDIMSKARDIKRDLRSKESRPKDADYTIIDEKDNNMVI